MQFLPAIVTKDAKEGIYITSDTDSPKRTDTEAEGKTIGGWIRDYEGNSPKIIAVILQKYLKF